MPGFRSTCYIESYTPAIYHASKSVIGHIDHIQDRLLRRIGFSNINALSSFSLVPLATRRDIAMLGVLHKVSHGIAPEPICKLFPKGPVVAPLQYPFWIGFHLNRLSHSRQLLSPCIPLSSDRFQRSIFGLVPLFNVLPGWLFDIPLTKQFQSVLQKGLLRFSDRSSENWPRLYRGEWRNLTNAGLDSLFSKDDIKTTVASLKSKG